MAEPKKKKIGEILLEAGLINQKVLDEAVAYQQKYGGGITQYLVSFGYLQEEDLASCVSMQFGVPYLPLRTYDIPENIIKIIPGYIVKQHYIIPVDLADEVLTVVMVNPLDTAAIEDVQLAVGYEIRPYVGTVSEIAAAMEQYYGIYVKDGKLLSQEVERPEIYSGVERRKSKRFKAEIGVVIDLKDKQFKSKTKNISALGVLFDSEEKFVPGACMTLVFGLPLLFYPQPIEAVIQVVRCHPREDNMFDVGAVFTKIEKRGLTILLEYAYGAFNTKKHPGKSAGYSYSDIWDKNR